MTEAARWDLEREAGPAAEALEGSPSSVRSTHPGGIPGGAGAGSGGGGGRRAGGRSKQQGASGPGDTEKEGEEGGRDGGDEEMEDVEDGGAGRDFDDFIDDSEDVLMLAKGGVVGREHVGQGDQGVGVSASSGGASSDSEAAESEEGEDDDEEEDGEGDEGGEVQGQRAWNAAHLRPNQTQVLVGGAGNGRRKQTSPMKASGDAKGAGGEEEGGGEAGEQEEGGAAPMQGVEEVAGVEAGGAGGAADKEGRQTEAQAGDGGGAEGVAGVAGGVGGGGGGGSAEGGEAQTYVQTGPAAPADPDASMRGEGSGGAGGAEPGGEPGGADTIGDAGEGAARDKVHGEQHDSGVVADELQPPPPAQPAAPAGAGKDAGSPQHPPPSAEEEEEAPMPAMEAEMRRARLEHFTVPGPREPLGLRPGDAVCVRRCPRRSLYARWEAGYTVTGETGERWEVQQRCGEEEEEDGMVIGQAVDVSAGLICFCFASLCLCLLCTQWGAHTPGMLVVVAPAAFTHSRFVLIRASSRAASLCVGRSQHAHIGTPRWKGSGGFTPLWLCAQRRRWRWCRWLQPHRHCPFTAW